MSVPGPAAAAPPRARIESLSHEGRGVARVGGKTVFVDGALPGEQVTLRYLKRRGRFDEAVAVEILDPAPDRVEPPCEYAARCGGCTLQHLDPAAQLRHKQAMLLEQFRHAGRVQPETVLPPLTGPSLGYRRKARLGVKYVRARERVLVGFREKHGNYIADIGHCPVLHPAVGNRLGALADLIGRLSVRSDLPQIEVAVAENETALVLRHLRSLTDADVAELRAFEQAEGLRLYLQPGGTDSVHPLDPGAQAMPAYRLAEFDLEFRFAPTDFTQVNFDVNARLVGRVLELLAPEPGHAVLDLFCGIGNFSLALARRAARVTGVEGDAELVERARANAGRNGIGNAEFVVADLARAEPQADYLRRGFDRVLLDPPRTGAKEILSVLEPGPISRLVYVSCNPATLARDAGILVADKGFRLAAAGVVDMFPHTAHVESVAVFERAA